MFLSSLPTPPGAIDSITIISIALNILILLVVLNLNAKFTKLSNRINKLNSSSSKPGSKSNESEDGDHQVEVAPGTPFEEFLSEDPNRRLLSKKEQFAAYRNWRDEKGLNWNNSNQ